MSMAICRKRIPYLVACGQWTRPFSVKPMATSRPLEIPNFFYTVPSYKPMPNGIFHFSLVILAIIALQISHSLCCVNCSPSIELIFHNEMP